MTEPRGKRMARDYFHSLPLPSISLFREMGMEEQDLGYHQFDEVSEISDEVDMSTRTEDIPRRGFSGLFPGYRRPGNLSPDSRKYQPSQDSSYEIQAIPGHSTPDSRKYPVSQHRSIDGPGHSPDLQRFPISQNGSFDISGHPTPSLSSKEQSRGFHPQGTPYGSQPFFPPTFGYPGFTPSRYDSQEQMLPPRFGEFTPDLSGFGAPLVPDQFLNGRGSRLRPKTTRHGHTWLMIITACIIATFSIYFSYRVLVSHREVPKYLALSPGKTVLVVNVLSHVTALLCLHLFIDTSEALRWAWACNPRSGILFTSFLALSRATPLAGIWHLMFKKGGHQLWCFLRLLTLVLYQTIGLILIADITFRRMYNPSSSPPIRIVAGTAPFNSMFVSVVPVAIVSTFATSYTQGFLTDPRYVISTPAINCKDNCTSIFLPGSLEIARIDNGDRNATLFREHLEGDSLLINNAPGYQVEFEAHGSDFRFQNTSCSMHMKSLIDGLWICAEDDGLKMNVGWSICPTAIYDARTCQKNTTWTQSLDQSTSVSIYKRYATTAYDFRNMSILSIESLSAPVQENIDSKDFLLFLNIVLGPIPKILNSTDTDFTKFQAGATNYAVQFALGWILRLYKVDYNVYNDGGMKLLQGFVAVMLQFSTTIWQQFSLSTLPTDMKVTATVVTNSYRAMIPLWTVLIFGGLSVTLLCWSITCLAWVHFIGPPTPNSSPFPELDITSKSSLPLLGSRGDDLGSYMRSNGLANSTGRSAINRIRRRKIYCGVCLDPQTGEEVIALVTEKGLVAPLQEHFKYS